MKYIVGCFSILLLAVACRPVKKIQKIETAIGPKDTAQKTVVVKPAESVDSTKIIAATMKKVLQHTINFKTFEAKKIKFQYESQDANNSAIASIRIKKDSIIWISIKVPIVDEIYRMLITKDSVTLMSKAPGNKYVQYRKISYLQEMAQVPFDFYTLQDLIVGNAIFIDSNIVSYKTANDKMQVLMIGKLFKNLITIDATSDFKILYSKLDDIDPMANRTCDITYAVYENSVAGFPFATYRHISISEKTKLDIYLDFKSYTFNEMLTFPFNIPKSYRVK